MPDQITVSEFVAETNEDYKSPTASNFTTRMSHCRNTVAALEEVSDCGGTGIVVLINNLTKIFSLGLSFHGIYLVKLTCLVNNKDVCQLRVVGHLYTI